MPDHWQIWTAINNRSLDPTKASGTYLRCYDSGKVERVVSPEDGTGDEIIVVKEADNGAIL